MSNLTAGPAEGLAASDAGSAEFRIVVNGLEMSPAMWARIVAAVRGLFPKQTAGLSDTGAVQALMRDLASEWVAIWEGRQAGPEPSQAAHDAMKQASAVQRSAEHQARADVDADVRPTVTS